MGRQRSGLRQEHVVRTSYSKIRRRALWTVGYGCGYESTASGGPENSFVLGSTRCSLLIGVSVGVGKVQGDRRGGLSENYS